MGSYILEQIMELQRVAPKKQRILCDYILHNCSSAYMMTAAELAQNAGVGVATVMRLAERLKCDGFGDMKKKLSEACLERFSANEFREPFAQEHSANSDLSLRYPALQEALQHTLSGLDQQQISKAIDLLFNSRSVNVLGLRSSRALALYFCYQLENLMPNVRDISENADLIYDRLLHFSETDQLVIISNTPTSKSIINYAEFCYKNGIPLLLITDNNNHPIAHYASACIVTPHIVEGRYSIIPSVTVLEILLNEIGNRTSPMSTRYINKRNQFFKDNDICIY